MLISSQETCPLPEHPVLAEVASALNQAGVWGFIFDREYRLVYMTDELRLTAGDLVEMGPVPLGAHVFGSEYIDAALRWPGARWTLDTARSAFSALGPWVLSDAPGGLEELRALVDPRLRDILDDLPSSENPTALTYVAAGSALGGAVPYDVRVFAERIRDARGEVVGTTLLVTTEVGMSTIGAAAGIGDLGHFERMQRVAKAGRRPAAILFADLEGSSALARRLSTASYFALGRRLARAADQCVIDVGGLVGRHVGDGVVAFFLAETVGSESAAARACIEACRSLREAIGEVAARSELAPEDLVLRFGLHWGSNLYVGNITTPGRSAIRSTKPPGSKPAPAAGARSHPRI